MCFGQGWQWVSHIPLVHYHQYVSQCAASRVFPALGGVCIFPAPLVLVPSVAEQPAAAQPTAGPVSQAMGGGAAAVVFGFCGGWPSSVRPAISSGAARGGIGSGGRGGGWQVSSRVRSSSQRRGFGATERGGRISAKLQLWSSQLTFGHRASAAVPTVQSAAVSCQAATAARYGKLGSSSSGHSSLARRVSNLLGEHSSMLVVWSSLARRVSTC